MPNERQLTLHTPSLSGNQALMVRRIEGREGLSQLFTYDVTLYAKSDNVKFSDVLGHELCVGLTLPRGGERYFHGYVASFGNVGSEGEFTVYRAELRPHLWRLTRSTNCRIFQNVSVPEIVEGILKEYSIDLKPDYDGGNRKVNYLPWNYCVQYRESDFAFISRLLEQEGLHYYFRHEKSKHTLVLADSNVGVKAGAIKNYEKVEYTRANNMQNRRDGKGENPSELIWDFRLTSSVLPDRVTLTDYDFRTPKEPLARDSGSEVSRDHGRATPSEYEVYDHLETVVQQDGYSAELTSDYARIRAEEAHVRYAVASAQTDARGLCAGAVVSLINGPEATKGIDYLILRSELSAEVDLRSSGSSHGGGMLYHCRYEAIDHKHPYRAPRVTPKPVIPGPQSAIVAGPNGSGDIATDEWGRIFVKFHWARKLKDDDKDLSCWIRVSQNSAGANWGSMFIPHIGQEVLVGFIEGDPDRPVVIGKVYNGLNKPPLTLPVHQYKSIIRDHYSNEILFDGTPGEEHIVLHSPNHRSAILLGRSVEEFTTSKKKSYSYDTESYTFGKKFSFTKGTSFSVDRGFIGSVKVGASGTVTVGAELKIGLASTIDVKVGTTVSIAQSASYAFGFSREIKRSTGTYIRSSSKDAILDSQKTIYVCGGKNDNTMMTSNDTELTLSFDDSAVNRHAEMEKLDAKAKRAFFTTVGATAGASLLGATMAQFEIDRSKEQHAKNSVVSTIKTDTSNISDLGLSDAYVGAGALASALSAWKEMPDGDIPAPQHNSPSAKIVLKSSSIELFAGKDRESEIVVREQDGITLHGTKDVALSSDHGMRMVAKETIKLKGSDVTIDCKLNHRNLVALP